MLIGILLNLCTICVGGGLGGVKWKNCPTQMHSLIVTNATLL